MGKMICFLNNKGGVGKTTSAVTVAHMAAAEYHKRVLLIDMDPQANTTSRFSETDYVSILNGIFAGEVGTDNGMVESLLMDATADPHGCVRSTDYVGLDLLPCCQMLSEVEERMKADVRAPQQFRLKAQLDKIRNEYDLIVADCSPSISLLNINVLAAADEVYIPARCDGDSLIGVAITMNLIRTVQAYNPSLVMRGVFFTHHDQRRNVSRAAAALLGTVLEETGAKLLPHTIRSATILEQAAFTQKPLAAVDSRKEEKVTQDYLKFTEFILNPDVEE